MSRSGCPDDENKRGVPMMKTRGVSESGNFSIKVLDVNMIDVIEKYY